MELRFSYRRAFQIWRKKFAVWVDIAGLAISIVGSAFGPDWLWGFLLGMFLYSSVTEWVNAKWQAKVEAFKEDILNGRVKIESTK